MNILFFGDIIGAPGRQAIKKILPSWRRKYQPDLIVANCENLAHGKGITHQTIAELKSYGIDAFTSGNHIWNQKQAQDIVQDQENNVLRPANYPPGVPGVGYRVLEVGVKKLALVNLIGRVFFQEDFDCPFRAADEIIQKLKKQEVKLIVVDFHVEATSEAIALGWYLDGRTSLVLGTHTHVQTADERILPQGTGYLTDIGMVGARDSVIGFGCQRVIENFLTQMPAQFSVAEGDVLVNAVHCVLDDKTGRTQRIQRVSEIVT